MPGPGSGPGIGLRSSPWLRSPRASGPGAAMIPACPGRPVPPRLKRRTQAAQTAGIVRRSAPTHAGGSQRASAMSASAGALPAAPRRVPAWERDGVWTRRPGHAPPPGTVATQPPRRLLRRARPRIRSLPGHGRRRKPLARRRQPGSRVDRRTDQPAPRPLRDPHTKPLGGGRAGRGRCAQPRLERLSRSRSAPAAHRVLCRSEAKEEASWPTRPTPRS
jgi:hypothetical protein